LRLLRTTLLLDLTPAGSGHERPRSVLFLSPDTADGRSTVIADLALVQREAGERAVVVEADFRRPALARMLGLAERSGLAEVLAGSLTLEEALQAVPASRREAIAGAVGAGGEGTTALAAPEEGAVLALPARAAAWGNPPALLSSAPMREVLRTLSDEFDHVLVDVPSPLEFSDAMPLLSSVDGIVIVARLGHTRERSALRLRQLLERTPSAPVIGIVANAVPAREVERYGMSAQRPRHDWVSRLTRR
jgi:Mrp family chromosome partitioning ATPase